jgi:SAM-dependent methyltransferase
MTESSYKTKYDAEKAASWRPGKPTAETRLVDRVFEGIAPGTSVLDIPCGNGRFATHLARKGYLVTAADYSNPMLDLTRKAAAAKSLSFPVVRADVESLCFSGRQFETVFCFRLFHHFPDIPTRKRVVSQLCGVASKYVAISYFSPNSISSIKRNFERRYCGKTLKKQATPLDEINDYFEEHGFGLVRDFPLWNVIYTLHVALYSKRR